MSNMKIVIPLIITILALLIFGVKQEIKKGEKSIMEENITNITIINVYDNVEFDPKFRTGFGFAAVVKLKDETILFDTGGDPETLLANLQTARIKPEDIGVIVLSHAHSDHTGGLLGFLEKNSNVEVYVPKSFPSSFKEKIKATGAGVVDVGNSLRIAEGVYSTGELGMRIKEQSLVINSNKGLIVITGCAHPGIVNIVKKAKELTKEGVYLVTGGFHLGGTSDSKLKEIINSFRKLGVKKVGPCHCSGDRCRELFKEEYGNDFIEVGVGKIIGI